MCRIIRVADEDVVASEGRWQIGRFDDHLDRVDARITRPFRVTGAVDLADAEASKYFSRNSVNASAGS